MQTLSGVQILDAAQLYWAVPRKARTYTLLISGPLQYLLRMTSPPKGIMKQHLSAMSHRSPAWPKVMREGLSSIARQ